MSDLKTITISSFKATCLAVLETVRRTGQSIIVTKHGKPIAQIDPPPPADPRRGWLGSFRDKGTIRGDIVAPAASEADWESL